MQVSGSQRVLSDYLGGVPLRVSMPTGLASPCPIAAGVGQNLRNGP